MAEIYLWNLWLKLIAAIVRNSLTGSLVYETHTPLYLRCRIVVDERVIRWLPT